ncbi:MAG: tetratricopeptide repeat protein [Verrucomicrobiota bacterium]
MKPKRYPLTPPSRSKSCKVTPKLKRIADIQITSARRRWFRITALIGPFLLLALLELGLRLAGCGYPTSFFLNSHQGDRPMLKDNPKFGWRFFPPEVARAPRPLFLDAQKPPGTVRIFVLGESAAMGDPEPAYGFARQLERILQARHPNQAIEIVNAAMVAINSHVIREIARDCAAHQGDFWLVFAGNNEVIGPYGAGTVFGRQAEGLTSVRLNLALKSTRVGQLLAEVGRSPSEPINWDGMELFLGQQVPHMDPRLKNVYSNFAANLADIADLGQQSGATVLFATVPVNLRDSPPFASQHRPGLRPEELTQWEQDYAAGQRAQEEGRFEEALSCYRKAAQIDGDFAQLIFQRARCELELKQAALADADFRTARDLDTLRFRTDSRLNQIIRQTAAAKGVLLADADEQFDSQPEGIPGENLFYDHVHLNFAGNYRVAALFAAELEKHWPGARTLATPWLPAAEVARRLAFTDFDRRRVDSEMRARLQQPPFNAQSNFRRRDDHWRETIASLSEPPASFCSDYLSAVALAPADWVLHAHFAGLLEAAKDTPHAIEQWLEVTRLLPHYTRAWASLGQLARLAGDPARADAYLREGLKQQPDSVETLTELGILEAGRGDTQGALLGFQTALRHRRGYSPARINLALLLASEGDAAAAAAQYREEIRWHNDSVDARINLANLLGTKGETGQALALYEQAVNLQPDNAITRYNLGRLLAANNRLADAVTNLAIALQQRPDVAEIHFELGNALSRLGNDADALVQFAEATRLKPELVDAHLNYGVALARIGHYPEAAAEFRETLRLRPQDASAQHMLDQALRGTP